MLLCIISEKKLVGMFVMFLFVSFLYAVGNNLWQASFFSGHITHGVKTPLQFSILKYKGENWNVFKIMYARGLNVVQGECETSQLTHSQSLSRIITKLVHFATLSQSEKTKNSVCVCVCVCVLSMNICEDMRVFLQCSRQHCLNRTYLLVSIPFLVFDVRNYRDVYHKITVSPILGCFRLE